MGSLNVLIEALKSIQGDVDSITSQSSSTYDLVQVLANDIAAPIVTAIESQNVSIDLTPLINAVNAVQVAVTVMDTDVKALDSDLKSHIDAMSAAIQSAISAKNPNFGFTTATKSTVSPAAATSALLFAANPSRKGFTIYNNSTNSLYVCIENPAVAANLIDFCGSNAGPTSVVKWTGPGVPTQAIYVIRNAGTGNVTGWEFS